MRFPKDKVMQMKNKLASMAPDVSAMLPPMAQPNLPPDPAMLSTGILENQVGRDFANLPRGNVEAYNKALNSPQVMGARNELARRRTAERAEAEKLRQKNTFVATAGRALTNPNAYKYNSAFMNATPETVSDIATARGYDMPATSFEQYLPPQAQTERATARNDIKQSSGTLTEQEKLTAQQDEAQKAREMEIVKEEKIAEIADLAAKRDAAIRAKEFETSAKLQKELVKAQQEFEMLKKNKEADDKFAESIIGSDLPLSVKRSAYKQRTGQEMPMTPAEKAAEEQAALGALGYTPEKINEIASTIGSLGSWQAIWSDADEQEASVAISYIEDIMQMSPQSAKKLGNIEGFLKQILNKSSMPDVKQQAIDLLKQLTLNKNPMSTVDDMPPVI